MKRRNQRIISSIVSVLCILALMLSLGACVQQVPQDDPLAEQRRALYAQAVEQLKANPLKVDGSNEMSEALLTAISNAEYTQPKNIILMIGDGMGMAAVEAAQRVYADRLYNGTLAMNQLPLQNGQTTYSVSSDVTDSAAGATALATGFKTTNKVIGMDFLAQTARLTLLELAASKGMATGVVSNEDITDATPAAFTAHVSTRYEQEAIAASQIQKLTDGSLDLVLGGGYGFYEAASNAAGLTAMQSAGVTYSKNWNEIQQASLPFCGLFAEVFIETSDKTLPTIAQMTNLALNSLDGQENGFFLMVEGAHIDTYGEAMNYERTVEEVYEFDCAVAIAMRYVALHPDTVLVVTADHETGGLWIPNVGTEDNVMEHSFVSGKHSNKKVPLKAAGYGVDALNGVKENVDVAIFLASLMGESNFGQASTVLSKSNQATQVTFSAGNSTHVIPADNIPALNNKQDMVTVFHVTMENKSEDVFSLPLLGLTKGKKTFTIKPQIHYIEGGQKMVVSYTIPFDLRVAAQYEKVTQVLLMLEEEAVLTISDVYTTTRPTGK
jgi:alkaline phosphatase